MGDETDVRREASSVPPCRDVLLPNSNFSGTLFCEYSTGAHPLRGPRCRERSRGKRVRTRLRHPASIPYASFSIARRGSRIEVAAKACQRAVTARTGPFRRVLQFHPRRLAQRFVPSRGSAISWPRQIAKGTQAQAFSMNAYLPNISAIVELFQSQYGYLAFHGQATLSVASDAALSALGTSLLAIIAAQRLPFLTPTLSSLSAISQSFPLQRSLPSYLLYWD
ncbi:hypothetical protein ACVWYQ_006293 [Bradyrhizobium sp. USDA 3397]